MAMGCLGPVRIESLAGSGLAKTMPPRSLGGGGLIPFVYIYTTYHTGPIERGGVVVQSWQRVPSTLLQEHCQREKRPRPSYR